MGKMFLSWEALKLGSLGGPESGSAGHSKPLTVYSTQKGVPNMAPSPENTSSFF